ncbi:MerR family transcriptional regulator [Blastococcus sp. TF02-8]|uniref:MerR family transcriptional regulator n=1 Tax=Blastococcus sp. TF02-8 TaxID=2250574 RepID=UPI001F0BD779|nr:MerR family transcriptional regulator [Blastococcus sp. TF02-8]
MTIGEFARAAGLTAKALRLYDETGLVRPAEVDAHTGYRYYRDDQLDRARLIARLRMVGMPLDRIRALADLPAAARAADLLSYWRQVEADNASRRRLLGDLVSDLNHEERAMSFEKSARPRSAARSGAGSRDRQLDALVTGHRLHAVADGFGSEPTTAARALEVLTPLDTTSGTADPVRLLDQAVGEAAAVVAQLPAEENGGPGCTLAALLLGDGAAVIAHVGDSRAHLVRDGQLTRMTRDHTIVQSLIDEGRLTESEASSDPRRADLNRALVAGRTPAPDLSLHAVRPGDRFVLTTDGVHAVLAKDRLARLLVDECEPAAVADAVERAVVAAGAPDNYAVVVVDLPADR